MIIPGQTLYVLECEPAAYAALAANEAEKAAEINVLEVRAYGSMGRIYLGGEERDIDVGWRAAVAALEGLDGKIEGRLAGARRPDCERRVSEANPSGRGRQVSAES